MTVRPGTRPSRSSISSARPSEKYSCSGSPLRFSNGRTAIAGLAGGGGLADVRLPDEQHRHRHEQHADDRDVRVATQPVDHGARCRVSRCVTFEPAVAQLEVPGERDRDGETENGGSDQRNHHPARHAERLEGHIRDLQQQPRDDGIARGDAEDAAFAQPGQHPGTMVSDGTTRSVVRSVASGHGACAILIILVITLSGNRFCIDSISTIQERVSSVAAATWAACPG